MEKDFSIYERLAALARSDQYPYHMPGHKRNANAGLPEGFAQLDITEIEPFDNLHHAQGILKEAMEGAAELYGADQTYFLVNGSTCGVLAAISAVAAQEETLILVRNAHMSAYHGVYLRRCHMVSLYPERLAGYGVYGAVEAKEAERLLRLHPEAKAVFITSPTYDGFVSDVEKLAEVVHAYGKILIVDEAHGAHFGLDERMPPSSLDCGADLVIHSLHKTLPSLTQTALLHVKGCRVDRGRLQRFLRIYQSSSPSYLLMGSIDQCIRQMRKHRGEWFDSFFERRGKLMKELSALQVLRIVPDESGTDAAHAGMPDRVGTDAAHAKMPDGSGAGRRTGYTDQEAENISNRCDPSKLMIFCDRAGISGVELQHMLLEDYHLQMEMAGAHYVLAVLTVMDTREGFARLTGALKEIDEALRQKKRTSEIVTEDALSDKDEFLSAVRSVQEQEDRMPLAQAMDTVDTEAVELSCAEGRVVTEFVYAYPPGISVILPGERMTKQIIGLLDSYREQGMTVQGPADETLRTIRCVPIGME